MNECHNNLYQPALFTLTQIESEIRIEYQIDLEIEVEIE